MTHLWTTSPSWNLIRSFKSPKKISVVGFSADGSCLFSANKFGDVLMTPTTPTSDHASPYETLLGHYCSVITSFSLNQDGTLLATTDRDAKIRISVIPTDPMAGAHEIQSFCFGHADFVNCCAFLKNGLLVSGGGDGTLRLWSPLDGTQLAVVDLRSTSNTSESTTYCPVLELCPSEDGRWVVAVTDGDRHLLVVKITQEGEGEGEGWNMEVTSRYDATKLPFVTDIVKDLEGNFVLVAGPLSGDGTGVVVDVACTRLNPETGVLEDTPLSDVFPGTGTEEEYQFICGGASGSGSGERNGGDGDGDGEEDKGNVDEIVRAATEAARAKPTKFLPGYFHRGRFEEGKSPSRNKKQKRGDDDNEEEEGEQE